MSNAVVEGLFLLSFFAPPLAVVVGALLLVMPGARQDASRTSEVATAHR